MIPFTESEFASGLERGRAEGALKALNTAAVLLDGAAREIERAEGRGAINDGDRKNLLAWPISIIELSLAALRKSLVVSEEETVA